MSSSSSSSSGRKVRRISLDEIEAATNNFDIKNIIGNGGEATVYLAKMKLGLDSEITKVAVKCLRAGTREFEREIEIISKIQHPNIVSLLGYCNEAGQNILVYEYMEKGSLTKYLEKDSRISLSWQRRVNICIDVARGLLHLHTETAEFPKGIIHGDVKPGVILLDKNGVAKISDFGMSKHSALDQQNSTMVTHIIGTAGYFAPEYLTYHTVTRKIDVYSFGVVLYKVLCLRSPWEQEDDDSDFFTGAEDYGLLALKNVDLRIKDEITDDALKIFTDIIRKSMKKNPRERPTMESVVVSLVKVALSLKSEEVEYEDKQGEAATKPISNHSTGDSYHRGESSEEGNTSEAIVPDVGGDIAKVLESQANSDPSSSSSSSSSGNCRGQISLDKIKEGTDNFSIVIGEGGEGEVYLAKMKLGPDSEITHAAVKRLKKASTQFDVEIKTMSNIDHPNLVSLLGYCDETGEKMLLYEYVENGSLTRYLKKKTGLSMSWQQRLSICIDAARGLSHLHAETDEYSKGIIHRDLKPDNILIDKNGVAKISDFGLFKLSKRAQEKSEMGTQVKGTGGYFAPEYVTYHKVTRKIDVYAFGIILYQVLCLKSPWAKEEEEDYSYTGYEDFALLARENVDPSIKDQITYDALKMFTKIIGQCMKKNPRRRPTMNSVVSSLVKVALTPESEDGDGCSSGILFCVNELGELLSENAQDVIERYLCR